MRRSRSGKCVCNIRNYENFQALQKGEIWTDQNTQQMPEAASSWKAKGAARLGTIMRKAAFAASLAATYVASTGTKSNAETLPLRCCLMSLSLPWDVLSHDLLYKVSMLFYWFIESIFL